jgi:hypothetical protein
MKIFVVAKSSVLPAPFKFSGAGISICNPIALVIHHHQV